MELKPCPFCGREDPVLVEAGPGARRFRCERCLATGPRTLHGKKRLMELWNQRVVPRKLEDKGKQ